MIPLTICYLTNRRISHFQWFRDSLNRQLEDLGDDAPVVDVIVVDHCCAVSHESILYESDRFRSLIFSRPKPNVWNGAHRLTAEDWFAAGNARNTALALCRSEWVAFVDDLSVLLPGWIAAALEAQNHPGTITCGAYRKVKELVVRDGLVVSRTEYPGGIDNRQKHLDPTLSVRMVRPCGGQWMYGCSLVAPLEAFLQINGWCEDIAGGIGFEDCLTGMVLENDGVKFRYDTGLMTFESEEDHHTEKPFRKTDKGTSPKDKSHAALDAVKGLKRFENSGQDLPELRRLILSGGSFPIPTAPTVDWYDGQPISEMT